MSEGQIQSAERPTIAFVLSLLAGLWMLAAGSMMGGFGWGGMMGNRRSMGYGQGMGHWQGMADWMWGRGTRAFGLWWPWFGLLAGALVIIGAIILYSRPEQRRTWGLVILIVSVLDFFLGMGGLLAGALGVIGGALAMAAKV
jgi:hypothetical protein